MVITPWPPGTGQQETGDRIRFFHDSLLMLAGDDRGIAGSIRLILIRKMPRGTSVRFSANFGEPTGAVWSRRYRPIIRTASPSLFLRSEVRGTLLSTPRQRSPLMLERRALKIEIISRMW